MGRLCWAIALALALLACATPRTTPGGEGQTLRPPDATAPAAGACAEAAGPVAEVALNEDTPSPRCVRVRGEQTLRVSNNTVRPARLRLGPVDLTVAPGASAEVGRQFGSYLAAGVHRLEVSTYGEGAVELWLQR